MIHVGVSGQANCFTLETQAHRKGYQRMDYFDKCPANHVCTADGAIRIKSKLNIEKICDDFNEACNDIDGVSAKSSCDAGRYDLNNISFTIIV